MIRVYIISTRTAYQKFSHSYNFISSTIIYSVNIVHLYFFSSLYYLRACKELGQWQYILSLEKFLRSMLKRRIIQNLRYLISTSLDVFSTMKVYPAPVHHLHVKPINGSALMSPIPTTIPIIQILNFVVIFALNIKSILFVKYYYSSQTLF